VATIRGKSRKKEPNQALDERLAGRQRLDSLYAPIREELIQFEAILHAELQSKYSAVDQLAKHAFRLGGKRLRPALLLLAAKAVGCVTREHLLLAAVVEMIHTATLVHDDVLDSAAMRRHLETINSRWGNQASVLLGDFLFTHAFYLASTLSSTLACQIIGRATNIVCEGELRQVASRGKLDLTEQEYFGIIGAKTAELCACCCQLGAHYAGADAQTEQALTQFGRGLGIAFQVVDDLLDLVGDETTTGKSLGTDLKQQKLTLPLIRLLSQLGPAEREEAVCLMQNGRPDRSDWFRNRLEQSDALEYTRLKAVSIAAAARQELNCLPPGPAKTVLCQLADFVVDRRQ
jgi:octaprenyl-diphosphate synthase